ncbi:MAG: hypothetical protein IPI97_14860 [Nitrosomonas sp.]|nr:hypothetical protein [Nitrosomonas sp.]
MLPTQTNSDQILAAFAEIIAKNQNPQAIQKTATGAPSGPYLHGPGGIFGVRGLSRDVVSTFTQITGSLGELLPIKSSNETNPLAAYITGFLRSDTQEKNGICDDPEEAGQMKTCIQTTVFGRKEFKSRELEVNAIGRVVNRGEFTDLRVVNGPLVNQMGGLMQNFYGISNQNAILGGQEIVSRMMEMAVAFQRWYCPQVYSGNPANSKAGGGYKEFMGLDLLIGTNKVDALSGTACPSLYSDIKSFGYRQISSTTDPDIHRTLSTMMYILETRAKQNNLSPVDFRIVMRSQLFFELTRVWPLQYNTSDTGLTPAGLDLVYLENVKMRDDMRNNNYLIINSKRYGVILDDCIPEENKADNAAIPIGGFASDIYIVPFTARGGTLQTLYWEYFSYTENVLPQMTGLPQWFWSDGGMFLWTMGAPKLWCMDVSAKTEPRLRLLTPQLAGRLTDVAYVPLQHINDPLPSQDYYVNGGVSTGRPFPSPFGEWNLAGPGVTA